jgi:predicted DCC family thiol-disulfide oxidoreductase YuxK
LITAILITDGDCEFCQRTAGKLKNVVPNGWTNVPTNELTETFGLTPAQLAKSVWLIEFVGTQTIKYSGAKAVGKVLRMRKGFWSLIGWLPFIPPMSWIAAGLYRLVANNRKFFSRFI